MAERIKIEIDEATLNALLNRLQGATTTAGGGMAGGGVVGGMRPTLAPGIGHVSSPRVQYAGGIVQSQPGGILPSIPRGIRTTMGMYPGGYEMVAMYQKGLWLEQGLNTIVAKGVSVAAVMELYTFAILMIVDILQSIEEMKRNLEENKQNIMSLSDINGLTYKAWEAVQKNPYRGRKT